MSNAWVAAVVGDIGGANELVPAMKILGREKVLWVVDPGPEARGGLVLDTAGIVYERRFPIPDDNPAVIVVGTSATAVSAQIAWTRFGRNTGIPVVWVEDWFGTGSRKATQVTAPDTMLTIHPIAEGIARNVRMDLVTKTVGKPSFARLLALAAKRNEIRAKARRDLGLEKRFLIHWTFTGEPAARPWEQIEEFKRVENTFRELNALVMPRFHPKHLQKGELEAAMEKLLGDQFVYPMIGLDEAIIASDLVIADWDSTDSLTALFLGTPVATTLFPDDFDERVENGFIGGISPILMRYEDWGLRRAADIYDRVRYDMSHREVGLFITQSRAQKFVGMCDPRAAERIANEISTHLGQ